MLLALLDKEQNKELGDPDTEFLCSTDLESILDTSFNTIRSAMEKLTEGGYIYQEREDEKPFRKFFKLTPKGRAAARHLEALEKELLAQA